MFIESKIWSRSLGKANRRIYMKAMIFAAGLGTRLKPLTDTIPKALVPVAGKPLLQHVIEKLKTSGFDEIIINVHHLAEQIIDFVESNNSFDIRIEFSDETEKLLDTGGAIKKASWFFDDGEPFLIHNVDILSNLDLAELCNFHITKGADISMVASPRSTFRYLLYNKNGNLSGWINEKSGEFKSPFVDFNVSDYRKLAFSGIQMFNPSLFELFDDLSDRFSIIDFYLNICDKKEVISFVPDNFSMVDVGKIDTLNEIDEYFSSLNYHQD